MKIQTNKVFVLGSEKVKVLKFRKARQPPTTLPVASQRVLDTLAQDITFKHRGKTRSDIPDERQLCYEKIKYNHRMYPACALV
jgi:hypothetical protein